MGSYRPLRAASKAAHRGSLASIELLSAESQSPVGSIESFSCEGISAQYIRVEPGDGCTFNWSGAAHYLALHDLNTRDAETFADDRRVDRRRDMRGRMTYVPPGCRAWGWSVPAAGPQSFTALYLNPAGMETELGARFRALPPSAQLYFTHTNLRSTLERLRSCLAAASAPDPMYLEALCLLTALELCQAMTTQADERPARGALGKVKALQIADYIEQNLGTDISLEDLARVAGLSRFHFLRAFKQATRETPYQHLLRRRIERAQELLRAGDLSIAEIAIVVGFKNSTRLSTAFRRLMDTTPSAYQAEARR